MNDLRFFLIFQGAITLIGFLVLSEAADLQSAASLAAGGLLILVNVTLTGFLLRQMIQKKQIALPLTIIIFKYAILGLIVYKLLGLPWLQRGWFCAGLGSLVISAPLGAFFAPKRETIEATSPNV